MDTSEKKVPEIGLHNTKLKEIWKISIYAILGPMLFYVLYLLLSVTIAMHCKSSNASGNDIGKASLPTDHQRLESASIETIDSTRKRPIFFIHGKSADEGHLRHVLGVLDRLGFERGNESSDWDLLWAHDYPFRALQLKDLKANQLVNHFPGCGYITNKADLSMTDSKSIPRSFKLPESKNEFFRYARENPDKSFVQKSNGHRGIRMIRNIDEDVNVERTDSFIQEFVEKPYLVDGYKFDVGIYTAITSIDPLRVYVYKGDVLFRFCPTKYYPLDPDDLDKYVVADDYLPIWNVPSLKHYYTKLGFSMKESFDAYVRSKGQDPEIMWNRAYEAIKDVALAKESQIAEIVKRYGNHRNYFELVRFDFTIDEDLNVYVMEANMSPNLSSAHFPPNRLLYEQVLFNLFALIGVARRTHGAFRPSSWEDREMEVADKNLVVFPEFCRSCKDCFQIECQLCKPCFTNETRHIMSQSYLERQNNMDFLRIFPPRVVTKEMDLRDYTLRNQLLVRWYQGKCELDPTWCN